MPSMQQSTAEPGAAGRPLGQEHRRRVRAPACRPADGHLEHAQLAHRAEPVLGRPHDAMRVMALALEVQHRVDDVLERLRPGEAAFLRDVADEERRDVLRLGREQQLRRRLAHLADAAGRRLHLQREHGLDRVDDDQRRLEPGHLLEDALEAGLGQQVERRVADAEPLAARLHLVLGFLARAVEHRPGGRGRRRPPSAAAASTCRCRARRRAAPASRARCRRRARDRTRRCRS